MIPASTSLELDAAPCSGLTWMTKEGLKKANYWGSLTQAATCRVGNFRGEEAYTPFSSLLPMVHPSNIVWGGWDISGLNLAEAMERAQVRAPEISHPLGRALLCLPLGAVSLSCTCLGLLWQVHLSLTLSAASPFVLG
jgi:hypothetical protein